MKLILNNQGVSDMASNFVERPPFTQYTMTQNWLLECQHKQWHVYDHVYQIVNTTIVYYESNH